MEPADIVQAVKDSGLRGRGGAGFLVRPQVVLPAPADGGPAGLVVNADESEPGTRGTSRSSWATCTSSLRASRSRRAPRRDHAFVYLRGEVTHVYRRLLQAVREATEAGVLSATCVSPLTRAPAHTSAVRRRPC